MGKTRRRIRKHFSTKKLDDHVARSKWTARNGLRLRSLQADIATFEAIKKEDILPSLSKEKLPPTKEVTSTRVMPEQVLLPKVKTKRSPTSVPNGWTSISLPNGEVLSLNDFTTKELLFKKEFASKQVSYLTKMLAALEVDQNVLLNNLRAKRRKWDILIGVISTILRTRISVS